MTTTKKDSGTKDTYILSTQDLDDGDDKEATELFKSAEICISAGSSMTIGYLADMLSPVKRFYIINLQRTDFEIEHVAQVRQHISDTCDHVFEAICKKLDIPIVPAPDMWYPQDAQQIPRWVSPLNRFAAIRLAQRILTQQDALDVTNGPIAPDGTCVVRVFVTPIGKGADIAALFRAVSFSYNDQFVVVKKAPFQATLKILPQPNQTVNIVLAYHFGVSARPTDEIPYTIITKS